MAFVLADENKADASISENTGSVNTVDTTDTTAEQTGTVADTTEATT
jgi:hypothetical protein